MRIPDTSKYPPQGLISNLVCATLPQKQYLTSSEMLLTDHSDDTTNENGLTQCNLKKCLYFDWPCGKTLDPTAIQQEHNNLDRIHSVYTIIY